MKAKHIKRLVIAVLVVSLVGGGWWYWFGRDSEVQESTTYVHRVGSIDAGAVDVVRARGILNCTGTWPAVIGIRGRITELVPSGTHVKAGDVLCSIDDTTVRETIESNETSLANAELSLVRLDAQYQLTEFQQNQTVLLSDARLKHAELEEREELEVPDARDRRLMDIAEALSELDVEDAQDEFERETRMFKKGYISESALEPVEQRLENAKSKLQELKLQNTLTKKGATDERRVELQMAVARAKSRKERAESRKARRIADIVAMQEAERKEIARLRYLLEYSEEELKKATVRAPRDGVFMVETYRDWTTGGTLKDVAVGDERYAFDVVGSLIDPSKMEISLVVHESDFHRLRTGLSVDVWLPAVPDRHFKGTVKRLGSIGRDRNHVDPTGILSGDSEISMFNVVVDLDSEGVTFHPGMSALVSINVSSDSKSLLIPRSAVTRVADGGMVVTLRGGGERRIKGHYFNEMYVEVEEGLAVGDELEISIYRGAE